MHQGYDCDSAVAGDAMPNAAIAAISVGLALLTMVFLLSFVCTLAARKRRVSGIGKEGVPWHALLSFITLVDQEFLIVAFAAAAGGCRAVRVGGRPGSSRDHGVSIEAALPAGNVAGLLRAIRTVAERLHVARAEVLVEGLSESRRRQDAGRDRNNRNELLHSTAPRLC